MRFNPKARLDTGRVRDRGRGRGGGRGTGAGGAGGLPIPGGLLGGGGITGVIVVVLFLVLTQCLGDGGGLGTDGSLDAGRMSDTGRYGSCKTGEDANNSADCARVAVENSLYAFWSGELGSRFRPEKEVVTFTAATSTGCGQASSDVGPFYCPVDETIYLDTTFFDDVLERQLGGPDGGFVEPYVLAHATGQALFASLTDQDIQQAIEAATAVGDDRIQQRSGGRVNPEQWTHGSAQQRVEWFTTGLRQGDLDACDTFAADAL